MTRWIKNLLGGSRPPRVLYRPQLQSYGEEGLEQFFTANKVVIEDKEEGTLIALGELTEADATVHSLMVWVPAAGSDDEEAVQIEFNDQGNARTGAEVERIELGPSHLRVVYAPDAPVYAGRVTYSSEADPFEDAEDLEEQWVRAVLVSFDVQAAPLDEMKAALQRITRSNARCLVCFS
jgi:hypothetical protein